MRSRAPMPRNRYNIIHTIRKILKGILKLGLTFVLLLTILVCYPSIGVVFPSISHSPKDSMALGTADMWMRSLEMATKWVTPADTKLFLLRYTIRDFAKVQVIEGSKYRTISRKALPGFGSPNLHIVVLRKGDDIVNGIFAPILLKNEEELMSTVGSTIFINEEYPVPQASIARGILFLLEAAHVFNYFENKNDPKDRAIINESYREFLELGKILPRTGGEEYHDLIQRLSIGSVLGVGSEMLNNGMSHEVGRIFGATTSKEERIVNVVFIIQMRFYLVDLQVKDPVKNQEAKIAVIEELERALGMKKESRFKTL